MQALLPERLLGDGVSLARRRDRDERERHLPRSSYQNAIANLAADARRRRQLRQGEPDACTTWIARIDGRLAAHHGSSRAGRPHPLVWHGQRRSRPSRRISPCSASSTAYSADQTRPTTSAYDPNGPSRYLASSPPISADYVSDWIAQKTLGAAKPTEPCAALAPNASGVPQILDDARQPHQLQPAPLQPVSRSCAVAAHEATNARAPRRREERHEDGFKRDRASFVPIV